MPQMSARIRRARAIAALTQSELARRLNLKRSAVSQWEQAQGTTPSVEHLAQVAVETGICFEWLATGRGPVRPDAATLETALIAEDYTRDELENRALLALRRLSNRRRLAAVQILELLGN